MRFGSTKRTKRQPKQSKPERDTAYTTMIISTLTPQTPAKQPVNNWLVYCLPSPNSLKLLIQVAGSTCSCERVLNFRLSISTSDYAYTTDMTRQNGIEQLGWALKDSAHASNRLLSLPLLLLAAENEFGSCNKRVTLTCFAR